jgi:hypothetical protein
MWRTNLVSESMELDVEPDLVQSAESRFVLVTGAGRSGTSTIAGALNYLGLHLPRPVLGTNRSNPRGFFESRWAIDFHKRLFERANIDTFDARPEALAKIHSAIRPEHRPEVEAWLRLEARQAPQLVVKDPRSAWIPRLWAEAAGNAGLSTGYVTMLRHPAEVVGSRSTYYAKGDDASIRHYQVMSVARWLNANLICEHETRGATRAFVRYQALLDDWRGELELVRADLDLTFNTDLASGEHHVVDQFVDPALSRHRVTWDDLDVPTHLRDVAEETWQVLCTLSDRHGKDEEAQSRLDALAERYSSLFRDAAAIAHDVAAADARKARRKAIREKRDKVRGQQQATDGNAQTAGSRSAATQSSTSSVASGMARAAKRATRWARGR